MKSKMEYLTAILAFVFVFIMQFSVFGCSSQKLSQKPTAELQINENQEVVQTKPLIDDVEIPRDFFDEIYPGYTRGITVVLTVSTNEKLSASQLKEIKELFQQSKAAGALHEVHILAWGSDRNDLSHSAAMNIEKVRAAIVPHFERTPVLVTSYNMEDTPAWASRLLMSKEARMRSYFSRIEKAKMFSKVIIGVSTTDQKSFVHPEMVSL